MNVIPAFQLKMRLEKGVIRKVQKVNLISLVLTLVESVEDGDLARFFDLAC